jgi:hypothetical protein
VPECIADLSRGHADERIALRQYVGLSNAIRLAVGNGQCARFAPQKRNIEFALTS